MSKKCPSCRATVGSNEIFPNASLTRLLDQHMVERQTRVQQQIAGEIALTSIPSNYLEISDINSMMESLAHKKRQLEACDSEPQTANLLSFLQQMFLMKSRQVDKLNGEMSILSEDITKIRARRKELGYKEVDTPNVSFHIADPITDSCLSLMSFNSSTFSDESMGSAKSLKRNHSCISSSPSNKRRSSLSDKDTKRSKQSNTFTVSSVNALPLDQELMKTHFFDLEKAYFKSKTVSTSPTEPLNIFGEKLASLTSKKCLTEVASTSKCAEPGRNNNILSSICFSRNEEMLAVAGVTKKIILFDYASCAKDPTKFEPSYSINWESKFSSLSWNHFIKQQLASSDYDGCVALWDAYVGAQIQAFVGHESRAWNVDFCSLDPTRLASSSDDGTVRIWDTNVGSGSTTVIAPKGGVNICSVKFNPLASNHVVFGSADHNVYHYDLRYSKSPLHVYRGHHKAVSYVAFQDKDTVVSASIDGTLRKWDLVTKTKLNTYKGHVNEKNFCGIGVHHEYLACGSEDNAVYVYHNDITKPAFSHKFGSTPKGRTGSNGVAGAFPAFVSSVCWNKLGSALIASNSRGVIKLLSFESTN